MSELPEGWVAATLGEVIDGFESGRNLRARGSPAKPGEYGVIKISAVTWGEFRPEENKALLDGDEPKDRELIRRGDVLISRANTTELVGAVVEVLSDYPHLMLPDKVLRVCALASMVHSPFLVRALRTRAARNHFAENASGTSDSMRNLSQPKLEATPISLPPLNEQKRIVAKIDVLTEKSREAREALAEVPELLDKLRQSILAAAFRGDLTKKWREQNPNVEPATALLERIRIERRKKWEEAELAKFKAKGKFPTDDKWKAKYVEPEPVDTDGLPDLPEGWCWASLAEAATIETGGTPPGALTGAYGGTTPFVKPTDLDAGFHVVGARQTLSDLGASHVQPVRTGSTLLTCIGATIGKVGFARTACSFNQQINAVTPHEGLRDEYVFWAVAGPAAQEWIRVNASATTLPILNKGRLARLPVPMCSSQEQELVALAIRDAHPQLTIVEDESGILGAQLSSLDASILAKAFRGELVPQDPNDEPASVLLERIRQAREGSATEKKRSKRGARTGV